MIMKIVYKIKYIILSVFFVFLLSLSAYAAKKTENNYIYLQVNQMQNINSQINQTTWVPNLDTGILDQTNSEITFKFFNPTYMSNFIVGFMMPNHYGVEMEYASYDLYSHKINGALAGNENYVQSNIRVEYVFFNFRQDFWTYKDINVFYKLGFGFIQPSFSSAMTDGGGNLEYGIQGDIGGYYAINDYIDFEVFYKLLGNYARRRELYSAGFEEKNKFVESSINWSVRFKLHSIIKKDVSVY